MSTRVCEHWCRIVAYEWLKSKSSVTSRQAKISYAELHGAMDAGKEPASIAVFMSLEKALIAVKKGSK